MNNYIYAPEVTEKINASIDSLENNEFADIITGSRAKRNENYNYPISNTQCKWPQIWIRLSLEGWGGARGVQRRLKNIDLGLKRVYSAFLAVDGFGQNCLLLAIIKSRMGETLPN